MAVGMMSFLVHHTLGVLVVPRSESNAFAIDGKLAHRHLFINWYKRMTASGDNSDTPQNLL
jgi:hypothetical protein